MEKEGNDATNKAELAFLCAVAANIEFPGIYCPHVVQKRILGKVYSEVANWNYDRYSSAEFA